MKKDIWLKPGKQLNTGAIIGGIGFAIYIALSALEWRGTAGKRIRTPSATTSCGAPARWRS